MKIKDILNIESIPEDTCDVCYVHQKANEFFENKNKDGNYYNISSNTIRCPICGEEISEYLIDTEVVGEANVVEKDDNINYYPIFKCCDKYFALIPKEIIYNGNHDIYYTGGKYYLSEEDRKNLVNKFTEKSKNHINNFVDRVTKGEKLDSWNLSLWLQYDLEEVIASFLYEKGLKE